MKPFLSISLVFLLLLNLFGFYGIFMIKQSGIRQQMFHLAEKSSGNNQHVITLSPRQFENLHWSVKGKELNMDGHLYDIARIEVNRTEVKLYVEEDDLETQLIADLLSFTRQQTNNNEATSPVIFLLSMVCSEVEVPSYNNIHFPVLVKVPVQPCTEANSSLYVSELLLPPPNAMS